MTNYEKLLLNINQMQITSVTAFMNISSGLASGKKNVYFARCIGFQDECKYIEQIKALDMRMDGEKSRGRGGYLRVNRLESGIGSVEVKRYAAVYESWFSEGTENACGQGAQGLDFYFEDAPRDQAVRGAFFKVLAIYRKSTVSVSESMVRNFGIKLLYWMDFYLPRIVMPTGGGPAQFPKFVFWGEIKAQEYLFLYLLVCLGCDVLYLNPERDVAFFEELGELSSCFMDRKLGPVAVPPYIESRAAAAPSAMEGSGAIAAGNTGYGNNTGGRNGKAGYDGSMARLDRERLVRPPSKNKKHYREDASVIPAAAVPGRSKSGAVERSPGAGAAGGAAAPAAGLGWIPPGPSAAAKRQPLEYEELAGLSPGIVMISVFDDQKKCFKTGSGVVVSEKGYILTNFHVACQASYYGIRFEEEERMYETAELIKYNQFYDLAVIRIDRRCTPIPVYGGGKDLVRGQKVVAIGSPLGLFNSVSDGIISGFRVFDDVSMIQFTAPISHGSSGGALLNLYGELIGIITAGFDDGQNINLAVDYKTARAFAGGFL